MNTHCYEWNNVKMLWEKNSIVSLPLVISPTCQFQLTNVTHPYTYKHTQRFVPFHTLLCALFARYLSQLIAYHRNLSRIINFNSCITTFHKMDNHILLNQSSIDKQISSNFKCHNHATLTTHRYNALRKSFLYIKKTCILSIMCFAIFIPSCYLSFDFRLCCLYVSCYTDYYLEKFSN